MLQMISKRRVEWRPLGRFPPSCLMGHPVFTHYRQL